MRILQRYVLFELLRVFGLLVSALTIMLVVVGVAGEAAANGLGAEQILKILPYIIPSLLPFTIPATLLLTVCVVYGRMAGDNEITALKAAGVNVLTLLLPSFVLAAVLSLCTFILTDQFIPWSRERIERIIVLAVEDIFLDVLRTRNQYTDARRGIAISVVRVDDDKRLIAPTFRYTLQGGRIVTVTAREASLRFDIPNQQVWLSLKQVQIETPGRDTVDLPQEERAFPLPMKYELPKARNITIENIRREMARLVDERDAQEQRRIVQTAFGLTQGDFKQFAPEELYKVRSQQRDCKERLAKLNTEIHSRLALSCSCFFFTFLGSPFAVFWARKHFLTSFASCFLPIVVVYYPMIMGTMSLGKSDVINPAWGMWTANLVIAAAAGWVLHRVLKH
jgi:lipopolysaccharide export system permease protein